MNKKIILWLLTFLSDKKALLEFRLQLQGPYSEAMILMCGSSSLTLLLTFLHILIGEPPGSGLGLASAGLAVSSAQWPANALGTMPILIPEEFPLL